MPPVLAIVRRKVPHAAYQMTVSVSSLAGFWSFFVSVKVNKKVREVCGVVLGQDATWNVQP